jgi:hypothetical protein
MSYILPWFGAYSLVCPGEWSEEQELALVKAMKQYGKELGAER